MKSKRRHELKQNVLDAELGQIVGFLKKRGTYLAWGLLIIAMIVLVYTYVQRRKRSNLQELRAEYDRVRTNQKITPEARLTKMKEFIDPAPDGTAALATGDQRTTALAMLDVANEYAARFASSGSNVTPQQRRSYGTLADRYYRRAINEFKSVPWAFARAHLAYGKLSESRREFGAAESSYQFVLKMGDDAGGLEAEAEYRIENLDRLRKETPVKMATSLPAEFTPKPPPATQPSTQPATKPAETTTQPAASQPAAKPAAAPARTGKPAPTTQPAGS